jgi:hypothetical protein
VLSRLFRRLFIDKLVAAYNARELEFFNGHAALADPQKFAGLLAPLRKSEWIVYSKRPFGGPEEVLRYLARYTHRVAISNRRLIACDKTGVRPPECVASSGESSFHYSAGLQSAGRSRRVLNNSSWLE